MTCEAIPILTPPVATASLSSQEGQSRSAMQTTKRISAERLRIIAEALELPPGILFDYLDNDQQSAAEHAVDPDPPSPEQGLRLQRAFLGIKNGSLRKAIVALVTELTMI